MKCLEDVGMLRTDPIMAVSYTHLTYLLKGDQGTKTINLEAHDAGLKGTLTNNGDGTATFTLDALKGGDKISIGGKQYRCV